MNVTRNNLSASRVELTIEVPAADMADFSRRAAVRISESTKIEGFRPGKAPYEIVRARVGDMAILEEAARLAVSKTIDTALTENISEEWIGQPEITVKKLAPENPFEYSALITLLPEVTLGTYKELKIKPEAVVVEDDEVERMITQLRDMRGQEVLVERAADTDDKVVADVKLFIDKVPVEGGDARETAVIIGKDYFVPGFDDNIKGMKAGDSRDFFVTYPSDHHQSNLAGKKVEFSVTVKQVFARELPAIDDAFAAAFGLKTADELRTNIKKSIEDEKKQAADLATEQKLLETVSKNATVGELPETLIQQETHTMLHELERNVARSGGKMDDYLASLGKSVAQLETDMKPQAIERITASLVLRKIVAEEKISVSADEINAELESLKKRYAKDAKTMEVLNNPAYRRQLQSTMLNRRVVEKLREWNIEKTV